MYLHTACEMTARRLITVFALIQPKAYNYNSVHSTHCSCEVQQKCMQVFFPWHICFWLESCKACVYMYVCMYDRRWTSAKVPFDPLSAFDFSKPKKLLAFAI